MARVYHWRHGWIPLDHTDAHSADVGIHSRQHVAKAALDLPNLPEHERQAAYQKLKAAADEHGAHDVIPFDTAGHAAPRSIVKRPDDHQWSALSDDKLDAAIGRAQSVGGKLLDDLKAEKQRRRDSAARFKR